MKITPIRSDETYQAYMERASELMSKTSQAAVDELEVLQALIERWERTLYELQPPSAIDAIRFRMTQQGLKPRDLEPYLGSRGRVSEVLSGTRPLSIDMIRALNRHLGIPAESLIASHDLTPPNQVRGQPSKAATDKLRTFGVMRARETVGQFVARVFGPTPQPSFLRKTRTERTNAKTDVAALEAWCAAVVVKADAVSMPKTRPKVRAQSGRELARLSVCPDGPRRAREALKTLGVVFVTLEHLPGTYLDGAVLRRSDGLPVIAMTLRHDRLDNFWFTLLHEFCHVAEHLDANTHFILDDLEVKTTDQIEEEADTFAQDALIPGKVWRRHASADLTTEDVLTIATEAEVHPAVVAGRWQRENADYRRFSKLLGRGEVRAHFADG